MEKRYKRAAVWLAAILVVAGMLALRHRKYDVCVYGATASGVMAAYSAAMMGCDVLLVEPSSHIGGMTTGGLGFTDSGNKYGIQGLARKFYRDLAVNSGHCGPTGALSLDKWTFCPGEASAEIEKFLDNPRIHLVKDCSALKAALKDGRIRSLRLSRGRRVKAGCFIDATYEGDLMALCGVSYATGREDNSLFGEDYNGCQLLSGHQFPDGIDPYVVPGDPSSGLLWGISDAALTPRGSGDSLIQAYNFRICLTDNPDNMVPLECPDSYDPSMYELLVRLMKAQPEKKSLEDWFIWSRLPGGKLDVNNKGAFSTDMIGGSQDYPEADAARRKEIVKAHRDYTLGLLWFVGHDPAVPEEIRNEMLRWGLPKDEYVDSGHWSPQLYVRESRRLRGEYVMTQHNCEGTMTVSDGVAWASYTMDSHNCRRIVVDGQTRNEGNVEVKITSPYPVSYRSLVPKRGECANLLVPVCLSASHIAYGSIRMEPVFMVTGQACGIAAALSVGRGVPVQEIKGEEVAEIIAADPYLDGTCPDVLVEDGGASLKGKWETRIDRFGYGKSYLVHNPDGKAASACLGPAIIPSAGIWEVWCYAHKRIASPAPRTKVVISSPLGKHETFIDQSSLGDVGQGYGDFVKVVEFAMSEGDSLSFTIDNSLYPAHELRVDDILLVKRQ